MLFCLRNRSALDQEGAAQKNATLLSFKATDVSSIRVVRYAKVEDGRGGPDNILSTSKQQTLGTPPEHCKAGQPSPLRGDSHRTVHCNALHFVSKHSEPDSHCPRRVEKESLTKLPQTVVSIALLMSTLSQRVSGVVQSPGCETALKFRTVVPPF